MLNTNKCQQNYRFKKQNIFQYYKLTVQLHSIMLEPKGLFTRIHINKETKNKSVCYIKV